MIRYDMLLIDISGEPNNYPTFGGENCVAIIYSCDGRAVGDWIDVPCLFNPRLINGAICKKPVDEPPTDSCKSWQCQRAYFLYHIAVVSIPLNILGGILCEFEGYN